MRLTCLLMGLFALTAAAQTLTIQVDGKTVGKEPTLNLVPGNGIVEICVDRQDQHRVDCTPSLNTTVAATHDTLHFNENYCSSTNGTTAYKCSLPNRALTSYRAGMAFLLTVDATCAASCSLDVDEVGRKNIKTPDGRRDPAGSLVAGQPQWVFYDGQVFRLMGSSGSGGEGGGETDQRGDVRARRVISKMTAIPYQATMTLEVTAGDMHKIRTEPNSGNAILNASTGGLAGQHMWIIVSNDTVSAKTITFGANILSAGPLRGSAGKSATLQFISDGSAWYEVARTQNL